MVFSLLKNPPKALLLLARACQRVGVRMVYVVTGQTVPQVTGTMTPRDIEALTIAGSLSEAQFQRWAAMGREMIERQRQ
jgi:hypothetical protein